MGTVFTNEGPRTLQDWQLQGLADSYRRSAYPEEEEVRRLTRDLFVSHDIVRRWCVFRSFGLIGSCFNG